MIFRLFALVAVLTLAITAQTPGKASLSGTLTEVGVLPACVSTTNPPTSDCPNQSGPADLRITGKTLSRKTAAALFGRLPKGVQIAAIEACSDTSLPLNVPQARILQGLKIQQGITVLPTSAAIAVVAAAQGKGAVATFGRYATASLTTISDLIVLKTINPGVGWGAAVITAATVLGVAIPAFSSATQTHQYMVLASSMLPDPVVLPALGCAQTAYALIESDSTANSFDLTIPVPKETTNQQ